MPTRMKSARNDGGRSDERHVGRWDRGSDCAHRGIPTLAAKIRRGGRLRVGQPQRGWGTRIFQWGTRHGRGSRCWRTRFSLPCCAAESGAGGDECAGDFDGGAGAAELAAGPGIRRGSGRDGAAASGKARPGWLPRTDVLPSGARRLTRGGRFACTWQAGEAQAIAAALGVPVVSNFRPADLLAGGQGAPLVPLLDFVLFADARRGRVLQNIGGIANLTAIPAGARADELIGFDTGPGNMVIDWLAQELSAGRSIGTARWRRRARCWRLCWPQRCAIPFSA